uniref:PGG domain-containing protein n=1 Tax=Aegilops tauschii subsp. strangulata TaxID=200361 RepID=A0A453RCR8_AEGTS
MEDSREQNGNDHALAAAGNTPDEPQQEGAYEAEPEQLQQDGADEAEPEQLQQDGADEAEPDEAELLLKLRKYLVLMAILVAAITFQAGLAPPGGFWQESKHGRVASDIVMRFSYPRRYLVFFYFNTTAFGASLMVLILLLMRELTHKAVWLRALQFAMILGLVGLMGAYAAGSCREVRTSVYIWVLLLGIFTYVTLHVVFFKHLAPQCLRDMFGGIRAYWKNTLGRIMTPGSGRTADEQGARGQ